MTIHYTTGVHRLVYKSVNFIAGLTVTGYIWNPSLSQSALQTFTEVSESFYELSYDFDSYGVWFGKFYEDGVGVVGGVFNIVDDTNFGVAVIRRSDIIILSSPITLIESIQSPVTIVEQLNSKVT